MKILKIITAAYLMFTTSLSMAAAESTGLPDNAIVLAITFLVVAFIVISALPALLAIVFMNNSVKPYQDLPQGKEYSGFWRRFTAGTIDGLILFCVFGIPELLLEHTDLTQKHYLLKWTFFFVKLTAPWLYLASFQSSRYQATPGMLLMKFKIYDEIMGKVGFWRLTGRYWSTLSVIVVVLIAPTIAFTKRKQGMHDMIARTVCVKN